MHQSQSSISFFTLSITFNTHPFLLKEHGQLLAELFLVYPAAQRRNGVLRQAIFDDELDQRIKHFFRVNHLLFSEFVNQIVRARHRVISRLELAAGHDQDRGSHRSSNS